MARHITPDPLPDPKVMASFATCIVISTASNMTSSNRAAISVIPGMAATEATEPAGPARIASCVVKYMENSWNGVTPVVSGTNPFTPTIFEMEQVRTNEWTSGADKVRGTFDLDHFAMDLLGLDFLGRDRVISSCDTSATRFDIDD